MAQLSCINLSGPVGTSDAVNYDNQFGFCEMGEGKKWLNVTINEARNSPNIDHY